MKVVLKPEAGAKVRIAEGPYERVFEGPGPHDISGDEIKRCCDTGLFEEFHETLTTEDAESTEKAKGQKKK